jgi:hypothetical protein
MNIDLNLQVLQQSQHSNFRRNGAIDLVSIGITRTTTIKNGFISFQRYVVDCTSSKHPLIHLQPLQLIHPSNFSGYRATD